MQKIKYLALAILVLMSGLVQAQITGDSPFSKYGIGNINQATTPQNTAMGGLALGIGSLNGYNNINLVNPAAYTSITLSTIDIGMSTAYTTVKNATSNVGRVNGSLSHIAFAFPVTSQSFKSALSFGLVPYSNIGYNFNSKTRIDTVSISNGNYGEGGINKIYLGYGFKIGEHLSLGANMDYYFGDMSHSKTTEFTNVTGAISSKIQDKTYVSGLGVTYGLQYDVMVGRKTKLVVGYAGSLNSKLNFENEQLATRFNLDADGNESAAIDTLSKTTINNKYVLPIKNSIGFTLQEDNHWLVGADYRMTNWSKVTLGNQNQGYSDTWGMSVGGQYTPNINAIGGYLNRVEYRLGFSYDKSYIKVNNNNYEQMSISAGMGLPLLNGRGSYYKINVALEYGQRGAVSTNGIKENYYGLHLGFLLNERWFQKVRFD